jgi:hypothetical protein
MWRESNAATAAAQQKHLEFMQQIAFNERANAAQQPAGQPPQTFDQQLNAGLSVIERVAGVMDKLRGPAAEPAGNPVHITTLPGGDTIVAGKDGIDTQMTGLFMAKDMVATGTKRIADALARRQVNASVASGGAASVVQASAGRPPRPT